jgi:ABC-type transporter Mla subunit MlaD
VNTQINDFKIGLFALFATALLLAALFIFGASKLFQHRTTEETYVTGSVDGLKEGAPVLLRGVPVGEVTRIRFTWNVYHRPEPRYVLVEFDVRDDVALVPPGRDFARHVAEQVAQGLRARIKSQGLIGASIVSLEYLDPKAFPPVPVPWRPRHIYIPAAPGQFSEMLSSLEKTISRLQTVDLQAITGGLERDLAAAERFLDHLDQVNVAGIATNADTLVTQLRETAGELRALVGTPRAGRGANLAELADNAAELVTGVRESITGIDRKIATVDTVTLNEAINNVQRASHELDEVLRELKTYPSGVLFGRPPPPARSVEVHQRR